MKKNWSKSHSLKQNHEEVKNYFRLRRFSYIWSLYIFREKISPGNLLPMPFLPPLFWIGTESYYIPIWEWQTTVVKHLRPK